MVKTRAINISDLPEAATETELTSAIATHNTDTANHADLRTAIDGKLTKPTNVAFVPTGAIQLGSKTAANAIYLDFYTSGDQTKAYDARFLFTNGNATKYSDCYFTANSFNWGKVGIQNQTPGQGDIALDNVWINAANSGGIIYKNRNQMFGDRGNASIFSYVGNNDPARNPTAGVMGFLSPSEVATYGLGGETLLENVTFYIENRGTNPTLSIATVTYSATGCTFASTNMANVKVGMYVSTTHSPRYTAKITAFDATSITCSDGWYQFGNTAAGQIPSNTQGIEINRQVKTYGMNVVTALDPGVQTAYAVTSEFDIYNMKGTPGTGSGNTYVGSVWGIHMASLGTYATSANFMSNGVNFVGYESQQSSEAAFLARNISGSGNGFETRQASNYAFVANPNNAGMVFNVNAINGAMQVGKKTGGAVETPIDIFTGFSPTTAGARISAKNGSATDLSADLGFLCGSIDMFCSAGVTSIRGGTTSGGWNGNHLTLGDRVTGLHIWANNKELRIKSGSAPISATDGTLIGTAP